MMRVLVISVVSVFAFATLLLLTRGVVLKWRNRLDQAKLDELRRRAVEILGTTEAIPPELKLAPRRIQRTIIFQLARSVAGAEQKNVQFLADELGLSAHALRQCRSRAWWKRLAGARLLTAIRSDSTVLSQLLDDPHPLVRAQALEWAGSRDNQPLLWHVATLLNDNSTACRFAAKDTLLRAQYTAVAPVRLYLETGSGPGIAEALEIVAGIPVPELAPAVEPYLHVEDAAIRTRAALARAAIGGSTAANSIRPLLADPSPGVRAAAASGLGTLHDVSAAGQLVKLMRDPVWEVRQHAGLALRALGAPGELLLRATLHSDDRFASDAARRALDAPAVPANYPSIVG